MQLEAALQATLEAVLELVKSTFSSAAFRRCSGSCIIDLRLLALKFATEISQVETFASPSLWLLLILLLMLLLLLMPLWQLHLMMPTCFL